MSTRGSWLRFAMTRAAVGERVVYVSPRHDSTLDAFRYAMDLAKQEPFAQCIARTYCARGEQEIRLTSGGMIKFLDPYCHRYRGASSDVLILEYGSETTGTATSLLGSKVVYRTAEDIPDFTSEATPARRYRKKPVEVEAIQWPTDDELDSASQRAAVHVWVWGHGGRTWVVTPKGNPDDVHVVIATLEGDMRINPGDWIIRGVAGEFYPCKPDIFEQTYESVYRAIDAVPETASEAEE
ncbi:Uncharacterised protein [Mycobacteroides abscessus subsp. abscessus]|nr:Uncharacterised protein [Mycobacteroides abscessus subsp. abscessus]SLI48098.1 Uncharacterised protein [Mycobacteroides abscessus subsp. abscessus]